MATFAALISRFFFSSPSITARIGCKSSEPWYVLPLTRYGRGAVDTGTIAVLHVTSDGGGVSFDDQSASKRFMSMPVLAASLQ